MNDTENRRTGYGVIALLIVGSLILSYMDSTALFIVSIPFNIFFGVAGVLFVWWLYGYPPNMPQTWIAWLEANVYDRVFDFLGIPRSKDNDDQ